jgi:hypothetical protein
VLGVPVPSDQALIRHLGPEEADSRELMVKLVQVVSERRDDGER